MMKWLLTVFVVVAVSVGGVRAEQAFGPRDLTVTAGLTVPAGPAFGPQELPPVDGPGL